jgi:hypothetical protein
MPLDVIVHAGGNSRNGLGFARRCPSAVGYQYQTWWALVELLRSGVGRPDAAIILALRA